jgi:hypothetical protein
MFSMLGTELQAVALYHHHAYMSGCIFSGGNHMCAVLRLAPLLDPYRWMHMLTVAVHCLCHHGLSARLMPPCRALACS